MEDTQRKHDRAELIPKSVVPIAELGRRLRCGSLTSVALTKQHLDRIENLNPKLNAFVTVTADLALRLAECADSDLAAGVDRGPLHGIPLALKDNIDLKDVRCTRGSVLFQDHVSDKNAAVTRCLLRSGAIILGKTAMHELAYGMNGINPHFGPTRNPWNTDYDTGGSSSGSAAAVAAGLAVAAIGTDTGGSVRQPAHSCGAVGFKPSFGRISNDGVFPLVRSMDHVGPITNSIADAREIFHAIREKAPNHSIRAQHKKFAAICGLRIGTPTPALFEGDRQVLMVINRALDRLRDAGANFTPLIYEHLERDLRAARTTFAEANTVLWDYYHAWPECFGEDVANKLRAAQKITRAEYCKAQRLRADVRLFVEGLFDRCDIVVLPTSTISAVPIDHRPKDHPFLAWRNCGLFNFTGHPAVSIPAGRAASGLPVGLMLVGQLNQDDILLDYAEAIEAVLLNSDS